MDEGLKRLELDKASERLAELATIYREAVDSGSLPLQTQEVNNHVHSTYSFSPYNPSQAAYMAWRAGLKAVGIMDHDSFAGSAEIVEAGKILGLGSTCGVELRVNADNTAMAGRSLNNPGSSGTFYMALHGIPAHARDAVREFLKPINDTRNTRNRKQVAAMNELTAKFGLKPVDFDSEVRKYSLADAGGSITERHILAALSRKIIEKLGAGASVPEFLQSRLGMTVPEKIRDLLSDEQNPHYMYDLLGVLKSQFLPRFFITPDNNECISAEKAVAFARSIGAIPAYAYLGDVAESPTGDKKAEKFEDSFLDELMLTLVEMGFLAITFMPPRNSLEQLQRLMRLCDEHGFMQISGVDINSSRQKFRCPEVLLPEFAHLNASTWALIAHECISSEFPGRGLFGSNCLAADNAPIDKRIEYYAQLAGEIDLHTLDVREIVERSTNKSKGVST